MGPTSPTSTSTVSSPSSNPFSAGYVKPYIEIPSKPCKTAECCHDKYLWAGSERDECIEFLDKKKDKEPKKKDREPKKKDKEPKKKDKEPTKRPKRTKRSKKSEDDDDDLSALIGKTGTKLLNLSDLEEMKNIYGSNVLLII